jgi:serine/threonine protein kinase
MTTNKNACRGTLAFMAPEISIPEVPVQELNVEFLKRVDVWAIGLTCYTLVNPSVSNPFICDLKKANVPQAKYLPQIREMLRKRELPSHLLEFKELQGTTWKRVERAYRLCAAFEPEKRPSAHDVSVYLASTDTER